MKRLIIETDLGHDPDDFFAICWLAAIGVQIDALCIVPGDPDQLAVANLFRDQCMPSMLIGVSKLSDKISSGGMHHKLLSRYNYPLMGEHDGLGQNVISRVWTPESELFVIGPCTSAGKFLTESGKTFKKATMQGGFLPYHIHSPVIRLSGFERKSACPTFNMNGDRKGVAALLSAGIDDLRFCGKNVCHTVIFDKEKANDFHEPTSRAAELFLEGAALYFKKHDSKKFHDPTAAVCHIHPEIGTWLAGEPARVDGGWTTNVDKYSAKVLADIDYDALWSHLWEWK